MGGWRLEVPLLPLTLIPAALILARKSLHPKPGTCHSCGYSLQGLQSPVCPECGRTQVLA